MRETVSEDSLRNPAVALLNGVRAVLRRPPTGADPPSPPRVQRAELGHSARQETACRGSRLHTVILSEPCDCIMGFDYQFMHQQFFFFFFSYIWRPGQL